jgi:hypothetical protein
LKIIKREKVIFLVMERFSQRTWRMSGANKKNQKNKMAGDKQKLLLLLLFK